VGFSRCNRESNLGRAGILVPSFLLVVEARATFAYICVAYSCSLSYRIIPTHVHGNTFSLCLIRHTSCGSVLEMILEV